MRKHCILALTFIIALNPLTGLELLGQQTGPRPHFGYRSPYRYAIVYDILREQPRFSPPTRTLVVLLDPKAFSDSNLRDLYLLLSTRFPKPDFLDVNVETSLEDIATPEESESPHSSGAQTSPEEGKAPNALFHRSAGTQEIAIWSTGAAAKPRVINLTPTDQDGPQ